MEKIIRLGTLLVAIVLTGCSGLGHWDSQLYRVNKKDTLYAIAWRYGLNYQELARWNDIPPPYIIHPGQELILIDPERLPAHRRPAPGRSDSPAKTVSENTAISTKTSPGKRSTMTPIVEVEPPKRFVWPVQGKVIKTFAGSTSVARGIDIEGKLGAAVVAVADGKVVYSGSGLTGYGKLLIVKHNDTYLSAYAHNKKLLVEEGEFVKSGQQIGEIGLNSDKQAVLHFEIRKQGKPVDPLKYLPKR